MKVIMVYRAFEVRGLQNSKQGPWRLFVRASTVLQIRLSQSLKRVCVGVEIWCLAICFSFFLMRLYS